MHQIFTVSDATGTTAERVVRAALVQFDAEDVNVIRFGEVRSAEQVREIVTEAARQKAFIVHTLISEELRHTMLTQGRAVDVVTIDLMGPLLSRLTEVLKAKPKGLPGGFEAFDRSYLKRMDAIDFSVRHDDGKNIHELEKAEIVLVGVSRTSKTPLSIFLSFRGWKVANIPLALGIEPPEQLFRLAKRKVVGLVILPERLAELRRVRSQHMGTVPQGYADLDHIRQEMIYAYQLFDRRKDWPLVDVTTKPIEETASEILSLLGHSIL